MGNRYIYIFIEVARREMDSRLALAVRLAKKGYSVIVGEKNQLLWNMFSGKYPPGVILDKCAQIATQPQFESLIKQGFVYTVLDEEGLITNPAYFNSHRFSPQAEKYTTANFVTGQNLDKIILSRYKNANNIVSGNPRYSMLLPQWEHWFARELNLVKNQYGSFVLMVSSFNPYPAVYKHALPGMKEIDDYFKAEMEKYLENNRGHGLNFVLRPHPSDRAYDYDSVQTDDRFNIIPWITASDYIINAKCTTSVESFIAGKRAYTWKLSTKELAYKIANIFADDLSEFGKPVRESIQARRKKILDNLLAHSDSAYDSINIVSEKISSLAFSANKAKTRYSIHKIMHLKNRARFFLKGDNYLRITQKFTGNDARLAHKKVSSYLDKCTIDDKVLELNC